MAGESGIEFEKIACTAPDVLAAVYRDDGVLGIDALGAQVSREELAASGQFIDPVERRHFLLRRTFQRSFMKSALGLGASLAEIPMISGRDKRPACAAAPEVCFSFSSSGAMAAAAAAFSGLAGIDIERERPVADASALAARFFHSGEAAELAALPERERQQAFLARWTIKEACLKAIGKGVVYGLDAFRIARAGNAWRLTPPPDYGSAEDWQVELPATRKGYILAIAAFRAAVT